MKKLFISQPMKDKTEEEIIQEREAIIAKAEKQLGEKVEILESIFHEYKLEFDELGNVLGMNIPEYNVITAEDSKMVISSKQRVQLMQLKEWNDKINNGTPLWYLAKSLELLAEADVAAFATDWNKYRGCKIEYTCATEYGIPVIYC